MLKYIYPVFTLILLVRCQSEPPQIDEEMIQPKGVSEILPFKTIDLANLNAFEEPSHNWQIVGGVHGDLHTKHDLDTEPGEGVLANITQAQENKNLHTKMEHGDLEIHFDVMMPKSSNSGIYFQGRYEVQLFDSWGNEEVDFADMGGIYQRWDDGRAEGERGFEGIDPKVNAAKAPGLWQHFHIFFRAPRFDAGGIKVKDAYFEFVKLNGFTLHQGVSLSGPTRASTFNDEAAIGPLMIQGDHGPVAFRNIRYKKYGLDTLMLDGITYEFYEGSWDFIPNWDTLIPTKSGDADLLDPKAISEQPDHYGMVFRGNLKVQTTGDYLFQTKIDDGGDLIIDSTLVVHNEGEPGEGTEHGVVHLEAGDHSFELSFYQEVWNASIRIDYEGPEISKRPLASNVTVPDWVKARRARPRLTIQPGDRPELVRGFVDHGPVKKTHAISIGDPSGIHFSYDLAKASLIKSWRGAFADVTNMWQGRGNTQLTIPMNAAVEFIDGLSIANLANDQSNWPTYLPEGFSYLGYNLDAEGKPHFKYRLNASEIDDWVTPTSEGRLKRVLSVRQEKDEVIWHRIGIASNISKLDNGLYSMDGLYYIDVKTNAQTRRAEEGDELIASATSESPAIEYEILW